MKSRLLPLLALALSAAPAQAAISLFAEYHLGETGSFLSNLPQDSSGNGRNFTSINGGAAVTSSLTPAALAGLNGVAGTSTAYLDTTSTTANTEIWTGADYTASLGSDYAFGIFAQVATAPTGQNRNVFSLGSNNGALSISCETNGQWRASRINQAYIGTGQAITANQWVHLAIIRTGGASSFYADGILLGTTDATAPTNTGGLRLSGLGSTAFDGKMDEARIVTFAAGESTANILAALQTGAGVSAVPEPSAYGLLGAGALGAAALARRRSRRSRAE